jgi:hypothetical protein
MNGGGGSRMTKKKVMSKPNKYPTLAKNARMGHPNSF